MRPELFTFDIFGTVVDWQRGLREDLARSGRVLEAGDFDRVVDHQGRDEQERFRPYAEITARSLVGVLGLAEPEAWRIGRELGSWPPFADAPAGLRALLQLAPCVAMTNSDRVHGEAIQQSLGLRLSDWLSAEEAGVYKPAPEFWHAVARRLGRAPSRAWWHVSAYADYDLEAAAGLGLTTVFVERPHRRPGRADVVVSDLVALARHVERLAHI